MNTQHIPEEFKKNTFLIKSIKDELSWTMYNMEGDVLISHEGSEQDFNEKARKYLREILSKPSSSSVNFYYNTGVSSLI